MIHLAESPVVDTPALDVRERTYAAVRAYWTQRLGDQESWLPLPTPPADCTQADHQSRVLARIGNRETHRNAPHPDILVVHPTIFSAPYGVALQAMGVSTNQGFIEDDGREPAQPDGSRDVANMATGLVGHSMLWFHDSGTFNFGDTASLDVTRISMVGLWTRTGSRQSNVFAKLTASPQVGGELAGDVHFGGSGSALMRVLTELDVFTTQDQNTPMAPFASSFDDPIDFNPTTIDQTARLTVPTGHMSTISVPISGLPVGTPVLLLAGAATRFVASVHHSSLTLGVVTTWTVNQIGGFF